MAIELTDGSRRRFEIPAPAAATTASFVAGEVLWVTAEEVAVRARWVDLLTSTAHETILRIDLSSLPVEPAP